MKRHDNTPPDQRLWENIRNGNMDALHDLFCELWDRHQRLKTTDNIKLYLFTILKRKLLKLKIRKSHLLAQKQGEEWVHEEISPLLDINYQSVVNNVFRAMQQLREELRGVPVV